MQLLKITSVPLEYEIHIEAARLEMKQAQNPSHVMTKNPSGWTMPAISRFGWIPQNSGPV